MFTWKTLLFKKKTPKKDQKKITTTVISPSPPPPPPSSLSRLTRSRSIHHSTCFDYDVSDDLVSQYQRMLDSSSTEEASCQSSSHESPKSPAIQETSDASGGVDGTHGIDVEASSEVVPGGFNGETEASPKQTSRHDPAHQSKEFLDFVELFSVHRELFLKILHDPSLLAPPERLEEEEPTSSSSGVVPTGKLEPLPRPGGSSGNRNQIFDSEKSSMTEIQRSPSRAKSELEASTASPAESASLKKAGSTSNRFKAMSKKIKDAMKENSRELARITKDGVFHKLPYGQKMAGLPKSHKFSREEKQMRRSYSIAESVDKYSTLYESIKREPSSKISLERPNAVEEHRASFKDYKSPTSIKRIASLPELRLYSPERDVQTELLDTQIMPKTRNVGSGHRPSDRNGSFNVGTEENHHPCDITRRTTYVCSDQNYGEGDVSLLGSLEDDLRSILRTPSLSSDAYSFSHPRINSLPSFDRSFFQDHSYSFTDHSVAGSEPTFDHVQLEDDEWLVKPPQPSGSFSAESKEDEWLMAPLHPPGINATHQQWSDETPRLLGANDVEDEEWLVKPVQPLSSGDRSDSDFQFIHESEQDDHIRVDDNNKDDFHYVKDILKKSGFSCGNVDWYAANQPVSPVIFEEAECSRLELEMAVVTDDEPHSVVRRMLLFDAINEVLLNIYDSSLIDGPWRSRFDSRIKPTPAGPRVLREVWVGISRYLSLQRSAAVTGGGEAAVDTIVAHDVRRKEDGWMELLYDVECVALDLEDLVVEDLVDDIVLQIVLISIDE